MWRRRQHMDQRFCDVVCFNVMPFLVQFVGFLFSETSVHCEFCLHKAGADGLHGGDKETSSAERIYSQMKCCFEYASLRRVDSINHTSVLGCNTVHILLFIMTYLVTLLWLI